MIPQAIVSQLIYVLVFLAVLFGIEGIYLMMHSNSKTRQATERRMRAEIARPLRDSPVNLRRHQIRRYGPVSAVIVRWFPNVGPYLAQIQGGQISPAMALSAGAIMATVITVLLFFVVQLPYYVAGGVGFLLALVIPLFAVNILMGGQHKKLAEQLPVAIDLVSRGLEAGHPVSVALGLVASELDAPIGPAFQIALAEMNYGLNRKTALGNLAAKYADTNLQFFVAALEMHRETGGDLASVLRNLSRVIRKRDMLRRKAFALSAEGRMTAFLVGGLPFVIIAAIYSMRPEYYTSVMDDEMFWPSMSLAFLLWGLGLFWIWRMTNIKV